MKIKLELFSLILGLLGSGMYLSIISLWREIPMELRELFRGGNIGSIILGVLILTGFIGLILFLINLIKSQYKLWWLRSIGFFCFILLTATFSNNV